MKAILEFTLPDEDDLYQGALLGSDWRAVVEDTLQELRTVLKYRTEELDDNALAAYEHMRTFILTTLQERGLFVA